MPSSIPDKSQPIWRSVAWAVAVYVATLLIIAMRISGITDNDGIKRDALENVGKNAKTGWVYSLAHADGEHFVSIARGGYSYDPKSRSEVAFFPVFPFTGRAIAAVTCLTIQNGLLLAAHAYLLGAFVLLALYARQRCGDPSTDAAGYALLAFGLFPPTFFFRHAVLGIQFPFSGDSRDARHAAAMANGRHGNDCWLGDRDPPGRRRARAGFLHELVAAIRKLAGAGFPVSSLGSRCHVRPNRLHAIPIRGIR